MAEVNNQQGLFEVSQKLLWHTSRCFSTRSCSNVK